MSEVAQSIEHPGLREVREEFEFSLSRGDQSRLAWNSKLFWKGRSQIADDREIDSRAGQDSTSSGSRELCSSLRRSSAWRSGSRQSSDNRSLGGWAESANLARVERAA